jgi:hypothetical protein
MRAQTPLPTLIGLMILLAGTQAQADCIGDESDAPRARATTPRTAPSAAAAGAPVPAALQYDFERTVQSAICAGAPGPSEGRAYFFTADMSFQQFLDVYWPYVSRIMSVDSRYRSVQLTSKTLVRVTCEGPCSANAMFSQNLRIELSVPGRDYRRPLTQATSVEDGWTRETFLAGSLTDPARASTPASERQTSTSGSQSHTRPASTVDQASLPLCKRAGSGGDAQVAAGAVASAGWALGGRLGGALWSGGNAANRAAQEQTRQENNQRPGVTCREQ